MRQLTIQFVLGMSLIRGKFMKETIKISDDRKWQVVVSCDRNYDGMFFYGVKTTGIFCRPSCKSKTPIRGNVIFFDNAAEAIEKGFRPCKRCCPDKIAFEPDLELIKRAKNIFDLDYNKQVNLNNVSKKIGISKNHLIRIFKKHTSITPIQYISKIRVDEAKRLLSEGDKSIIEVAYESGFKSLANFYKCFKEHTGYTPNKYRRGDDS